MTATSLDLTPETLDALRDLLDRLPAAPWFVSDCEGEVEVWQEAALLNVTRDESGEITGYRTPGCYKRNQLIYEQSLDTWDRDEEDGEDDDLRRDIAEFLAECRNQLPALLAELSEARETIAGLMNDVDELRAATAGA